MAGSKDFMQTNELGAFIAATKLQNNETKLS